MGFNSGFKGLIRTVPFSEPPFMCLSKFPVNELLPGSPKWGPYEESCPLPQPSIACLSNSSINILPINIDFQYATHNTLKPVPTLPRQQQTTIRYVHHSLFYRTYCIFRRIYIINNNCNFNLVYRYSLSVNLTLSITV